MNRYKIFIVSCIFIFSILLRLWNINKMGRTWDENAQVEQGYKVITLIQKGDFNNAYWYNHPDHPILTKYLYGLAAPFDIRFDSKGILFFRYDWTTSRLISVLFSSLTVAIVVLIGWRYFSPFVGIISGLILAMLPFLLGLSQLATIESILIFFFTTTVYTYIKFLEEPTQKNVFLTGLSLGLAFQTKYTNILLLPLFFLVLFIWKSQSKNKQKIPIKKIIFILLIALFIFFILWPMPWFHIPQVIEYTYKTRIANTEYSIPEVFFGRLKFLPKTYYIVMFLITTPFLLLVFFLNALFLIAGTEVKDSFYIRKRLYKKIKRKKLLYKTVFISLKRFKINFKTLYKKWMLYTLLVWFCVPFLQSFYNFRQHGIRYVIEIYAPFSLLAAIGIEFFYTNVLKNNIHKILFFIGFFLYLFAILLNITPYYLDYFNEVVGGTKGVYEKRLFQLGWWGQGLREATYFLENNVPQNSTVGLAVVPFSVVPPSTKLCLLSYDDNRVYDYVMVSYFHVVREGFNDELVQKNYTPFYSVKADGATIVQIYKSKRL